MQLMLTYKIRRNNHWNRLYIPICNATYTCFWAIVQSWTCVNLEEDVCSRRTAG